MMQKVPKICVISSVLNLLQERMSLPKSLRALKDLVDSRTLTDINDQEEPMGITGLEAFSLSYKVSYFGTCFSFTLLLHD